MQACRRLLVVLSDLLLDLFVLLGLSLGSLLLLSALGLLLLLRPVLACSVSFLALLVVFAVVGTLVLAAARLCLVSAHRVVVRAFRGAQEVRLVSVRDRGRPETSIYVMR